MAEKLCINEAIGVENLVFSNREGGKVTITFTFEIPSNTDDFIFLWDNQNQTGGGYAISFND